MSLPRGLEENLWKSYMEKNEKYSEKRHRR